MSDITIMIPAAGDSRRMRGTDKLTESVGGVPLLHSLASDALATGAQVVVTLPPLAHRFRATRLATLAGLPLTIETAPDAATGLSASLRAGLAAIGSQTKGVMILLADLPEIETRDLRAMIDAFLADPEAPTLRATSEDGQPGHPVILPRRLFQALARLTGDAGARDLLQAEAAAGRLRLFPLPGRRAITDLDTPEDWQAWRAADPRHA